MPDEVVARGAEAVLYLEKQKGKTILVKERIKKGYRIPALDEKIRTKRTRREAKLLSRAARAGIPVPKVLDSENEKIRMDFIEGRTVKDSLNDLPEKDRVWVCQRIGEMASFLHRNGMVHGDLTTSNMILKDKKLYLIDFGLGSFSQKVEDQAVDLFLLYEALKAAHYKYLNESWQNILKIYKQNYSNAPEVLKRFEKISLRRRYK
jgi:TP53 regulating kinase-like protein